MASTNRLLILEMKREKRDEDDNGRLRCCMVWYSLVVCYITPRCSGISLDTE